MWLWANGYAESQIFNMEYVKWIGVTAADSGDDTYFIEIELVGDQHKHAQRVYKGTRAECLELIELVVTKLVRKGEWVTGINKEMAIPTTSTIG